MNKVLAYYSIVLTAFAVVMCIFANDGDADTLIGGIMFTPVLYYLWTVTNEMKEIERNRKIKDEEIKKAQIKEEIKEELKSEKS